MTLTRLKKIFKAISSEEIREYCCYDCLDAKLSDTTIIIEEENIAYLIKEVGDDCKKYMIIEFHDPFGECTGMPYTDQIFNSTNAAWTFLSKELKG